MSLVYSTLYDESKSNCFDLRVCNLIVLVSVAVFLNCAALPIAYHASCRCRMHTSVDRIRIVFIYLIWKRKRIVFFKM